MEWASPVECKLHGDSAIGEGVTRFFFSKCISLLQIGFHLNLGNTALTKLFEGEPDHLTPSTSQFLQDSDMFVVAGRMIGHSILHGGPCVTGISPATMHVLLWGSLETATIQIEDCCDFDVRNTIHLLNGDSELSAEEKEAILNLSLAWDLPGVTEGNRRWLYEWLFLHAVVGHTSRQVKQIRRGLKETMVWPLLTERKDVIPLLFPRESEAIYNSEMILEQIVWPELDDDDSDNEECSLEDKYKVAGYLRTFIKNASSSNLKELLKFWTGWEIPSNDLQVEVMEGNLPRSSTCFQKLFIPAHYTCYSEFERDMLTCISCNDTGFGLI